MAAGAISQIIPAIIEAQSADVDVISGATATSTAIKEAVRQVLTENR
ncbi:MAG TPA: FMN-binding protein [Limnochordia bacterium]|nr:FMN-binding protein [Limnochordia bacterium]